MIVTDSVQAYLKASRPQPDPLPAEMQARGQWDGIPIVVPEAALEALNQRLLTDARLTGTIAPAGDGMLFVTCSGDRGGEG